MRNWCENEEKLTSNSPKLLEERIAKRNPCRRLTVEEERRLLNLEGKVAKLSIGKKVHNCQQQTWLNIFGYAIHNTGRDTVPVSKPGFHPLGFAV